MGWFDQKPAAEKKAVAYYRHSAQDKQEYSVEIQQEHVRKFAADNGIEIIKEFADRGITGVVVKDRDAFNEMISAYVEGGKEKFDFVLVFDVSRWGRFQDGDESAHYTWLCSSRGIKVIFSSMGFQKENDLFYGVYLNFERWRAARYSQELSEIGARVDACCVPPAARTEGDGRTPSDTVRVPFLWRSFPLLPLSVLSTLSTTTQ